MQTRQTNVKHIKIDDANPSSAINQIAEFLASESVQAANGGRRISGKEFKAQVQRTKKQIICDVQESKTVPDLSTTAALEEKINITHADWFKQHGFKNIKDAFHNFINNEVKELEKRAANQFVGFLTKGLNLINLEKIAKSNYSVLHKIMVDLEKCLPKLDKYFTEVLFDVADWLRAQNLGHEKISSLLEYQRMFKVLSAWVALLQLDYCPKDAPKLFHLNDMQELLSSHGIYYLDEKVTDISSLNPKVRGFIVRYCLLSDIVDEMIDAGGRLGVYERFHAAGYPEFFNTASFSLIYKKFGDLSSEQIPIGLKTVHFPTSKSTSLNAESIKEKLESLKYFLGFALKSSNFRIVAEREALIKSFIETVESTRSGLDKSSIDKISSIGTKIDRSYKDSASLQTVTHILHVLYLVNLEFLGIQNHVDLRKSKKNIYIDFLNSSNLFIRKLKAFLDKDVTYLIIPQENIAKYLEISFTIIFNQLSVFGLFLDSESKNFSEQESLQNTIENILEFYEFLRRFASHLKNHQRICTLNSNMVLPSSKKYQKPISSAASRTIFIPDASGNLYLTPEVYKFIQDFKTEFSEVKAKFIINRAKLEQKKLDIDKKYRDSLEEYSKKQGEIEKFAEDDSSKNQQKDLAKQETQRKQKERKLQKAFLPRFKSYSESSSSSDQASKLSEVEKEFQKAMSLRLEGKYHEANKILFFIAFETSSLENRDIVLYSLVYLALDYVNQTSVIAKACQKALIVKPNNLNAIFSMTQKADEVRILQNNLSLAVDKAAEITLQMGNDSGVKIQEALRINDHVMQMMTEIKNRMSVVQNKFNEICEKIKENKKRFKAEFPELYYNGNPDNPSPYAQMLRAIQEASSEVVETSAEIGEIRIKHQASKLSKCSFLKDKNPTEVKDDFEIGLSPKSISIMNKTSRLNPRHAEFFNQHRNEALKI